MSDDEMREMFKLFDIEGKVGCSPISGVKEKSKALKYEHHTKGVITSKSVRTALKRRFNDYDVSEEDIKVGIGDF